jgi:hypothetical protein
MVWPRRSNRLLAGLQRALHAIDPRTDPAGDDPEPLPELGVNMLAVALPERLAGHRTHGGLTVAVLVTAPHHWPLSGDLVLVEIAAP